MLVFLIEDRVRWLMVRLALGLGKLINLLQPICRSYGVMKGVLKAEFECVRVENVSEGA